MAKKKEKTHYQMLGVAPSATLAEIKKAYRDLVKAFHPDPGSSTKKESARKLANEKMQSLNIAYETLKDRTKRAEYDIIIGIHKNIKLLVPIIETVSESEEREKFLYQNFNPTRATIDTTLSKFKAQVKELSQDPYDDDLVNAFVEYVDQLESSLRKGSQALSKSKTPRSLEAAVQIMRYSIAQAADALEELRNYCGNYDYNHLTMAENLFRIAIDLSKQSYRLTKNV